MDFWISFANFFASAIRLTAPIALGTLACTISERAGVINIGIEGSMLFSGFLAAVGSYYTGSPWVGLLCGCAAGVFLALILGIHRAGLIAICMEYPVTIRRQPGIKTLATERRILITTKPQQTVKN